MHCVTDQLFSLTLHQKKASFRIQKTQPFPWKGFILDCAIVSRTTRCNSVFTQMKLKITLLYLMQINIFIVVLLF